MIGIQVHIHPSNGTFYIKRTKNGGMPKELSNFKYYQRETRSLQHKGSKFDDFLIDFASVDKIEFWEEFYYDLFRSWGFIFIHKNFIENRSTLFVRYFSNLFNNYYDYELPIILTNPLCLDDLAPSLNLI